MALHVRSSYVISRPFGLRSLDFNRDVLSILGGYGGAEAAAHDLDVQHAHDSLHEALAACDEALRADAEA